MKKKNSILISKVVAIVAILLLIPACNDFQSAGIVTDNDGNVYQTVVIGTQTWMRENLKTTKYNDGTEIPLITNDSSWKTMKTPAYCWYNNDTKYKKTYGALYNWFTIHTGKLAPVGWHVASKDEWKILSDYLTAKPGKSENAGSALASSGDWTVTDIQVNPYSYTEKDISPVGNAKNKNNSSGFNAQPSGYRNTMSGSNTTFKDLGKTTMWWCSDSGLGESNAMVSYIGLTYVSSSFGASLDYSTNGCSVRCIKD